MSTTDTTTTPTTPSAEELELWTAQTRDWFNETDKKRLPKEMREDLLAQGAKYCYTCQTTKAVTEYSKNSSMADGLRSQCRPCKNGSNAEYYADNREERLTYHSAYRAANREEWNEYSRRYHEANREERNECRRRYRAEHLEEQRDYDRTRYATDEMNRLRRQLNSGYHRAVEAGVHADWVTPEELLTFWSARGIDPLTCVLTGEQLTPENRSIDHATPIGRGGSHRPSNLIPVSFEANLAKGSRTLLEFLADRAAEQDPEELPDLVRKAMEPRAPRCIRRSLVLNPDSLTEEADRA